MKKIFELIENESISIAELNIISLSQIEIEGEIVDMAYETLNNSTEEKVMCYLAERYSHVKKITNRYLFGDLAVEDKGEEYLVCNYLRRDITSLKLLSNTLTKREYAANKNKVLVLTWHGYIEEVKNKLETIEPGRDFIKIISVYKRDMEAATPIQTSV